MVNEVVVDPSTLSQTDSASVMPPVIPFGVVFLAARKEKSLTQQDVSSVLRLSIKQIEALETNDFAALPEAMITRGFVRNYARLLEIDAEPLLDSYRSQVPEKSPNSLSVNSSLHQVVTNNQQQSLAKYIVVSGLVLGCLLIWLFYMNFMPKSTQIIAQTTPDATAPVVASTEMVLPELALPVAERQEDTSASTNAINTDSADVNIVNDGNAAKPSQGAVEAGSTSTQAQSTAVDFHALKANAVRAADQTIQIKAVTTPVSSAQIASQVQPVPVGVNGAKASSALKIDTKLNIQPNVKELVVGAKKVSFSASERSWVSVTNKSGKVVFEKMLAAGSEDSFDAEPPLNVSIGNAQATKLMFSGKAVDLATTTKNNVAHLILE